jgi:D-sedoheptulose 7-phosphate isomerase
MNHIQQQINESILLKTKLLSDEFLIKQIEEIINDLCLAFNGKNKVLFCGNGGSAADAQHLAAEFSGRYYYDRPPLNAEALHVNTSYITAVANDYSFDNVYSRMVDAIANEGDVLIALSTSGNSPNVVNAVLKANEKKVKTISFTGLGGGKLKEISALTIEIPSQDTPRIQECHMLIGHIICEMVEAKMFPKK